MTLDEWLVCKMAICLPFLTRLDIDDCTVETMPTQSIEDVDTQTPCASSSLRLVQCCLAGMDIACEEQSTSPTVSWVRMRESLQIS